MAKKNGAEAPPTQETENTAPQEPTKEAAPPLQLEVTARPITPIGNLVGFASVKFNDCFVVEDFKILQNDKGMFVGMPSKPDKSNNTGYRDTANPLPQTFARN